MAKPAVLTMIDGATEPIISNTFVNNISDVLTLQITGTFSSATVLVEGLVNVQTNAWTTLAAFNLTDLSLKTGDGMEEEGVYQVSVAGILKVRIRVSAITGGDITVAANFIGSTVSNRAAAYHPSPLEPITAYDLAVLGGYTGTLEQFETDMGNSAANAASAAASAASVSASAAQIAINQRNIERFNAFDIWDGMLTRSNGTSHKVVYTWSGEVCTVTTPNGASDDYSANILLASSALPASVVPGGTYYVKYSTTNADVRLRIIFKDSGGVNISPTKYFTGDASVTIPSNAAQWTVSLFIGPNVTLPTAVTISNIHFLNTKTNAELDAADASLSDALSKAVVMRGTLANNTDLDTVKTPGIWLLSSGYSYAHAPHPSGYSAILCVFPSSDLSAEQVVYTLTVSSMTALHCYVRSEYQGNYGSTWKQMDGMPPYGVIPNNTNLDTLKVSGNWVLQSGYTYTNSPIQSSLAGLLVVFPGSANTIVQSVFALSKTNADNVHMYVRCAVGGTFDNNGVYAGWRQIDGNGATYNSSYTLQSYENTYNITCSPAITTDTNNYLASTGDTTDRTAAIQTMLNTTGTCHLGPGNFYVTGVEVPDNASLIGSGNGTILYLASSVADGYTVKLKTHSSVSHMQFRGSDSVPTLTSTVGTRHGIVFESDIVSSLDGGTGEGTVYKQSAITCCAIANFTGGGIVLTGTGVDVASNTLISDCFIDHCGAGIYIPYYSEFHRVSNCAVTRCWYGTVDNGGNNNFSNCDFSGCRVGIQISPSTNNSHGSFTNCSVNHSRSAAGEANKGTAILLQGAIYGEIFTGMQVFFGAIVVQDSVGVRFIGMNLGSDVPITVTNNSVITFSDCTFKDAPTKASSLFTKSGNTMLKFTDCYLRDGNVYNPA